MRKYSDFPVHPLALRLLLATASASFVAAMSGCDRGQPPAPSPTPTAIAPAPAGGHSAGALTSCLPGTDGGSRSVPGDPAPTPSARDGQNPAGAWHFSYVATQSSEESWKSTHDVHIRNISACGKGSMVVDAPPEQDGQVIINTEQGDPVTSSAVNGTYRYHESDVRTGLANELEGKRIDDYSGTPEQGQGLLFEYNAKDPEDQAGIQAAGISFDTSGTYEIWNHDAEGKLRKATNQVDQKHGGGISLGRQEDKVVRMKNGFAIDYDQSKDTASTDAEGVRHAFKSRKRYHAELVWVGNH